MPLAAPVALSSQSWVSGRGRSDKKGIGRGACTGLPAVSKNTSWEGGWVLRPRKKPRGGSDLRIQGVASCCSVPK